MRFTRFALSLALLGCSSAQEPPTVPSTSPEPLSFEEGASLRLLANETRPLHLIGGAETPAQVWLDGEYGDASLDRSSVSLDGGRGTFSIRAPGAPAVFAVHAKQGTASPIKLAVSVSPNGFGSLVLSALYQGRRSQTDLAASVFLGKSCASLSDGSISDGGLVTNGKSGAPLLIENVPAGVSVAVQLRLAHVAKGCVEVPSLVPEQRLPLEIELFDVPLQVYGTKIDAELAFSQIKEESERWDGALRTEKTAFLDAAFPTTSEATRVVDRLIQASANPTAFTSARASAGWDASAESWLSMKVPGTLREKISAWTEAGLPKTRAVFSAVLSS